MYAHDSLVIKTIYYIVNVMFTEAELFAIRYEINQATHIPNIKLLSLQISSMLPREFLIHHCILI